jgi:hypothetical protein
LGIVRRRRARFQGWGRGPVGWSHGQSFLFQFVALGQIKRPSRRRASIGEVRSGKGQLEGRIQGRFGGQLRFGWSRVGPAFEPIELREFWPSHLGREAVTRWQQRFGLEFVAIFRRFVFRRFVFRSNGFRPAFGSVVSIRCSCAFGLQPTIKFVGSNGFRPPESSIRQF